MSDLSLPGLAQSLQGRDLGHLQIIAEFWGVGLNVTDPNSTLQRLVDELLRPNVVRLVCGDLTPESTEAMYDLVQNGGRLPWATFTRRHGQVREIGIARRDRERPYLDTGFPAEALWYRGILGRSFFKTARGPEEFAYIPADLLALIPAKKSSDQLSWGRLASQKEQALILSADDAIVDWACSLLAGLRAGLSPEIIYQEFSLDLDEAGVLANFLKSILRAAGILDKEHEPIPEPTRLLLEQSRGATLASFVTTWLDNQSLNELRMRVEYSFEGEWSNDPLQARRSFLDFLKQSQISNPAESQTNPGFARPESVERPFINLSSFIQAVKNNHPDFQRPSGDYDSWFIREIKTDKYLRGFESWDRVEGDFIRFMVTGPLHWLGLLDLAVPSKPEPGTLVPNVAYRYSAWAKSLLSGEIPDGLKSEAEPLFVNSDGLVRIPRYAPRAIRYQIARFGEWEGWRDGFYHYRLTSKSLAQAGEQGLRAGHLLSLIKRNAAIVPPTLVKALTRWDQSGLEAAVQKTTILRVKNPELLKALQNSRGSKFLGDVLGPTTVIVKAGATSKVLSILAEMGYIGAVEEEGG